MFNVNKVWDVRCKQNSVRCKIWDVRLWDVTFWAARRWERGRVEFQWADSPHLTPVSLTVKLTSSSLLSPPQLSPGSGQNSSDSDIDQLTSSSSENNCQVYQARRDKTTPVTGGPRSAILKCNYYPNYLLFTLHFSVRSEQFHFWK